MRAPTDAMTSIKHVRPVSLVCSLEPARRPLQPSLKRFASASRPCARLSSCLAVAALPATAAEFSLAMWATLSTLRAISLLAALCSRKACEI